MAALSKVEITNLEIFVSEYVALGSEAPASKAALVDAILDVADCQDEEDEVKYYQDLAASVKACRKIPTLTIHNNPFPSSADKALSGTWLYAV